MRGQNFFVTGGALQADADSYVPRAADRELLEALRNGEFCYVLTSRQMGKSSLMVRTAVALREQGSAVVILDLTAIGQNLDVEQWYFSMLCHVGEKLGLETEMENYWDANMRRAPLHRFMGALREVYLERKRKPLVMFVDEIDAVRSLRQFSADEFFAGIRECFNRRPEDPKLERLTFCLLGVATPSDLIRDERITPFNIGHAIELRDFDRAEANVLAGGLSPHRDTALLLLDRILW
jgi:AAA-like domain